MGILSKCVSGAAKNVTISNFILMFIGYVSFLLHFCANHMQFPVLDFELDHYGSDRALHIMKPYLYLHIGTATTACKVRGVVIIIVSFDLYTSGQFAAQDPHL